VCDETDKLSARYKDFVDGWQHTLVSLKTCDDPQEYQRVLSVSKALFREVEIAREELFNHRREHGC